VHKQLEDHYASDPDVVFFHLQTVFEGESSNTPERGPKEAKKYNIKVPVGYDAHLDGDPTSVFMRTYGTGGTPWTVVIDKTGVVRHNAVTSDEKTLRKLIDRLRNTKETTGN
jgi:hypothetical protein